MLLCRCAHGCKGCSSQLQARALCPGFRKGSLQPLDDARKLQKNGQLELLIVLVSDNTELRQPQRIVTSANKAYKTDVSALSAPQFILHAVLR